MITLAKDFLTSSLTLLEGAKPILDGILVIGTFKISYCDGFLLWAEFISPRLDFGDALVLPKTNFVIGLMSPVLVLEEAFEFELFVECIAGLLNYCVFVMGVGCYFFTETNFLMSGFLKRLPVEVTFAKTGFYLFLDWALCKFFIWMLIIIWKFY